MENRQRLVWVDRMRGLAILSVVIQHLTYCYSNDLVYHKLIGISNMAVFFFISGYIWEKTAHINNMAEAMSFLVKKTRQLLLPLLVWNIVTPYFFHTDWQLPTVSTFVEVFTEPHLWFLLTLYGYCFYFVLFKLFNKWGGRYGIAFWVLSYILLFIVWRKFGLFKFETLYFVYFAVGTLVAGNKWVEEKGLSNSVVSVLSFIAILLLTNFWVSGQTSVLNVVIKMVVSCSVIVVTYLSCTRLNWNVHFDSFIRQCGQFSLAIYVMHWIFLHVWTDVDIPQNELLAFFPVFLYAVIICYACILLKKIVALSPFMDFVLFGNKLTRLP